MRQTQHVELIKALKKGAALERWWWRESDISGPSRWCALLYELAARLDAKTAKRAGKTTLPYWLGRPWPDLSVAEKGLLHRLWPARVEPIHIHFVWPDGIDQARELYPDGPVDEFSGAEWSHWCLVSFNLQHDNNALLRSLGDVLKQLREASGQPPRNVGEGLPKRQVSFRCVELLDKQLFKEPVLDASTDRHLRRQVKSYAPIIDYGRLHFSELFPDVKPAPPEPRPPKSRTVKKKP